MDRSGRLIPLDKDDQIISLSEAERLGILGRDFLEREESSLVDLYIDDRRSRKELEKLYTTSPERGTGTTVFTVFQKRGQLSHAEYSRGSDSAYSDLDKFSTLLSESNTHPLPIY